MSDETTPEVTESAARRPRRRRRWRRYLLVSTGGASLLAALLVYWLLATSSGGRWVVEQGLSRMPAGTEVEIGSLDGSLLGGLELQDVHYRDAEGVELRVDQLDVHVALLPLRRYRVVLHHLRARGVTVDLPEAAPPSDDPVALPEIILPVSVALIDGQVETLLVRRASAAAGEEPQDANLLQLQHVWLTGQLAGRPGTVPTSTTPSSTTPTSTTPTSTTRAAADAPPVSETGDDVAGHLLLDRLDIDAATWSLRSQGRAVLRGSYPFELQVESLRHDALAASGVVDAVTEPAGADAAAGEPTPETTGFHLQGRAGGDLTRLDVEAVLRPADATTAWASDPRVPVRVRASVQDVLADLQLDGTVVFEHLDVERLYPQVPVQRLAGEVGFGGRPDQLRLDLNLDAESREYGNWQVRGNAGLPSAEETRAAATDSAPIAHFRDLSLRRVDGPGSLLLDASLDARGIEVASVEGQLQRSRLRGEGRLDWQPELAWDFDVEIRDLEPELVFPAAAADWPGRIHITAAMIGRRDPATNDLEGTLQLRQLEGRLRGNTLSGRGEIGFGLRPTDPLPEIEIADLQLAWGATLLQARGSLGLSPQGPARQGRPRGRGWDLEWRLEVPDLARLQSFLPEGPATAEPLSGRLQSQGRLLGAVDQPGLDATFQLDRVAFGARSVRSATGSVRFELRPGSPLHLDLQAEQLRAPELAALAPLPPPAAVSTVRTSEELGELASLELTADGTVGDHRLDLRFETPPLPSPSTSDLSTSGTMPPRWLELTLTGAAELPPSPSAVPGATPALPDFSAIGWRGTLERLRFQDPSAGTWTSREPAGLRFASGAASGRLRLDELCLARETESGEICAGIALQPAGGWRAEGRVQQLPMSLFASLLPPELGLEGDLDGNLLLRARVPPGSSASGSGRPPTVLSGRFEVQLSPGELRLPSEPGLPDLRRHEGGQVQASLQDGVLRGDGRLDLGALGFVESRFQVPLVALRTAEQVTEQAERLGIDPAELPGASAALRVHLRTQLQDLRFLDALTPALDDVRGVLDADVTWERAASPSPVVLRDPTLRGTLRLEQAQAKVPALGIRLRELSLDAQADGGHQVRVQGSATSGGGRLQVSGTAYPPLPGLVPATDSDSDPLLADLEVRGTDFLAQRSPELTLYISPDLQLRIRRQRIDVEGQVVVPRAVFDFEAGEAAIPVSADVVYVNDQPTSAPSEAEIPIYSRLQIILGDDVELRGNSLTLQPRGQLMLVDQPGRATTAVGELILDTGTYTLYGNTLTLDGGTILYTGNPIDNPGLRLKAYRATEDPDTRAGVSITGTAARPEIEIFTEPPTTPSDSLAFLLTGRPLAGTSEADSDMLVQAAAKLGLRRGNLLLQRLGQKIGLEEAKIESRGTLEDTSLFLGKQLTDRLYVVYRVGLIEPVSTLQIRYQLSEKWSLRGQTGEGSGGDLLYSVR